MEKANLALVDDLSVGDWIRESLHPLVLFSDIPVTIGIVIPRGYESYVLVRHSGPGDRHGGLGDETLSRLVEILSKFTNTPDQCLHALWEGYGWMQEGSIGGILPSRHPKSNNFLRAIFQKSKLLRPIYGRIGMYATMRRIRSQVKSLGHLQSLTLPEGIMASKRFELPNRNYLLMSGSIEEATKVGWNFVRSFQRQSPNLLWPIDRKWILVTEIDFNVTLIGGSVELVKNIINSGQFTTQIFNVTDAIDGLPVVE